MLSRRPTHCARPPRSRSAVGFGSTLLSSAAFVGLLLAPDGAVADLEPDTGIACGFIGVQPECPPEISDTATDSFRAAIDDQPTEYLSFSQDKDGNDLADPVGGFAQAVPGDLFSDLVVLSSPGPPEQPKQDHVQLSIDNQGLRGSVGPVVGFGGTMEIVFPAPHATAVGLGTVRFGLAPHGLADSITVYDPEGAVLYAGDGDGWSEDDEFTFIGFVAGPDERIEKVVLQGNVFSIQDLQFVPEPSATAQVLAVLAALGFIAALRAKD